MFFFHSSVSLLIILLSIELYFSSAAKVPKKLFASNEAYNVCDTDACFDTAAIILDNMDLNINPCDNFYKFACGGFIDKVTVPDAGDMVNIFTILERKIMKQLKNILEEQSSSDELKPFKLAKKYYKSCMNKRAIEKRRYTTLHKILEEVGGWPVLEGPKWNETDFHWTTSVEKLHKIGYSPNFFFDLFVEIDLKNSTKNILIIDQPPETEIHDSSSKFMMDIAVILGAPRNNVTEHELLETLNFEKALAEIITPKRELRDLSVIYNPMTIVQLSKSYSSIPWKKYINNILAPDVTVNDNEIVIVTVPKFFSKLVELINKTSKRIQANYVIWKAIEYSIEYLTQEMLERQLGFSSTLDGKIKLPERWQTCVNEAKKLFSTHALYAKKYFDEATKNNVTEIVTNIKNQLNETLHSIDWMDEETKKHALKKADAISSLIGYPSELLDDLELEKLYKNLKFNGYDFLKNHLKLNRHIIHDEFRNLRKPYNKTSWKSYGGVATVNAYYSRGLNKIILPAGILQESFFNNSRPKYMNYGAIGFAIAHEITHAFDDQGRKIDIHGNIKNWWTPSTNEAYLRKTQCIKNHYGNYTVEEVGRKLNAVNTLGEDISDIGGVRIAYLAYKNWSEHHKQEPSLPDGLGYNTKQMFWISLANIMCAKSRPKFLKDIIEKNPHSPHEFRVLGSFSNILEFSKDFNCPVESKMNPQTKCDFW